MNIHMELHDLVRALLKRVDELRAAGTKVQIQPNGFMRLALEGQKNADNGLFLHTWIPELPCQRFLHTHVFHLVSRVLKGSIKDTMYQMIPDDDGPYKLVKSRCTQEDCTITEIMTNAKMEIVRTLDITPGEFYEVRKGEFHTTAVTNKEETALTIIQKSDVEDVEPLLAVPNTIAVPMAPFSREIVDQDFAWQKINQLLNDSVI